MYKKLIKSSVDEVDESKWFKEGEKAGDIRWGKCFDLEGNIVYPYWSSFDKKSLNFHIVPSEKRSINKMGKIRRLLADKLKNNLKVLAPKKLSVGQNSAKEHKWIEVVVNNNVSCILGFQTLEFNEEGELNCYLDKIQFYAFPSNVDGPNFYRLNGTLSVMYPEARKKICIADSRIVYNTSLTMKDEPEDIVNAFLLFIEQVEQISCPRVY